MVRLCRNFTLSQTKLINFVNLSNDDKKMVLNWRNHSNIRRWMRNDTNIKLHNHLVFIRGLKNDKKNFYWLVKNISNKIGTIYLNNVDIKHKSAYLGVYANPKLKGVGCELMAALKELVFDLLGFHSLRLEVMENNLRALSFYKKSGFKKEGYLREAIYKNGIWCGLIIMGINNQKR